jgi:hypothetical protein
LRAGDEGKGDIYLGWGTSGVWEAQVKDFESERGYYLLRM